MSRQRSIPRIVFLRAVAVAGGIMCGIGATYCGVRGNWVCAAVFLLCLLALVVLAEGEA